MLIITAVILLVATMLIITAVILLVAILLAPILLIRFRKKWGSEVFAATGLAAHPYHQRLYLPYGESPMKVSVVTLPVFLSRVLTIVTSWIRLMVMLWSFEIATVRDPRHSHPEQREPER